MCSLFTGGLMDRYSNPLTQEIPFEQRRTLLELRNNDCRWPYGDKPSDPDFFFCGGPKIEGCSYCDMHHRISRGRAPREVPREVAAFRARMATRASKSNGQGILRGRLTA